MNSPFYSYLWGSNSPPPSGGQDVNAQDIKEIREGLGGVEGILDSAQKISERFQPKSDNSESSVLDTFDKYETLRSKLGGQQMPIGQQMKDLAEGMESFKTITGNGDNKEGPHPWIVDEEGELHRADDGSGEMTLNEALKLRREIKAEQRGNGGSSGDTPYLVDEEGNIHKADDGSGVYTMAGAIEVRKQIREEIMQHVHLERQRKRPFVVDGEGQIQRAPDDDGHFSFKEAVEVQTRVLQEKKREEAARSEQKERWYMDPDTGKWRKINPDDPPVIVNQKPSVFNWPGAENGQAPSFQSKEDLELYKEGRLAVSQINHEEESHKKKMEMLDAGTSKLDDIIGVAREAASSLGKRRESAPQNQQGPAPAEEPEQPPNDAPAADEGNDPGYEDGL